MTTNKYLKKIAGIADIAKSVGRVVGGGLQSYRNQVHLSLGGGFRDFARDNLGVKSLHKQTFYGGSPEKIEKLRRLYAQKNSIGNSFGDKRKVLRNFNNQVLPGLKKQQLDARIRTTAVTAGGVALGVKAKHKIDNMRTPEQVATDYYQNY